MKLKSVAVAAALALTGVVAQADIVIDNFNDPFNPPGQIVKVDTVGASDTSTLSGLTGVLGGSRTLTIECNSGCVPLTDRTASLQVAVGELAWVNGTNVRSTGTVLWDKSGTGLDANLLALGNSIVATILEADLGFNYVITLGTNGGGTTKLFSGTVTSVVDGSPEQAFYSLEWFTRASGDYFEAGLPFTILQAGGGASLDNVDFMSLQLNNVGACYIPTTNPGGACSTAVDLRIDDANLVPEPASVALVGIGLLGMAGLRRRRQA